MKTIIALTLFLAVGCASLPIRHNPPPPVNQDEYRSAYAESGRLPGSMVKKTIMGGSIDLNAPPNSITGPLTIRGLVTATFNPNTDGNFMYLDVPLRLTAAAGGGQAIYADTGGYVTNTTGVAFQAANTGAKWMNGTVWMQNTAPTISAGFGTSPSVVASNGTAAFTVNVGTGGAATNGTIGLPTATTGWRCDCEDITTKSATVFVTKQTATTTTTCTVGNYNTAGAAAAWVASDVLVCEATAY